MRLFRFQRPSSPLQGIRDRFALRPISLFVVGCVFVGTLSVGPQALADTIISNYMQALFDTEATPGHEAYALGTGTAEKVDFTTGTVTGVSEVSADGSTLSLDNTQSRLSDWEEQVCSVAPVEIPDWEAPRKPFRITLDTTASNTGVDDLRVFSVDPTTGVPQPLNFWVEGPIPSTETVVWVEAFEAEIERLCVIFSNPTGPGAQSDWQEVFSSPERSLRYYRIYDWPKSTATVTSYVDNNSIAVDGGAPFVLNAGQSVNVDIANGRDCCATIESSGPIEASETGVDRGSYIPESYAATEFAFINNRNQPHINLRAVDQPTTVEIIRNGVVEQVVDIEPADGIVGVRLNTTNRYVFARSVDDTPFLAAHYAFVANNNNYDLHHGIPGFGGEDLYGIGNRFLAVAGFDDGTQYQWAASNGAAGVGALGINQPRNTVFFGGNNGHGAAVRVSSPGNLWAASHADIDGQETEAFKPIRLMSTFYIAPYRNNIEYMAVVCPVVGTMVSRNGGAPVACNGANGVGKLRFANPGGGATLAGDHPFLVHIEYANQERPVLGFKVDIGRDPVLAWQAPPIPLSTCAFWESEDLAAADVMGLLEAIVDTPLPGFIIAEVSVDDGVTWLPAEVNAPLPFAVDGFNTYRLRISLCDGADDTVDPSIADLCSETSPVAVDHGTTVAVGDTGWALRVYYSDSLLGTDASGALLASTGDAIGEVVTDQPETIGTFDGTTIASANPTWIAGAPFHVGVDLTATPTTLSNVEVTLRTNPGVLVDIAYTLDLGP